jgi:sRNA-binding protein
MRLDAMCREVPKALHKADAEGARIRDTRGFGPGPLMREHLVHAHAQHAREQGTVFSERDADAPRKGKHPLAIRGDGQALIHQTSRRIRHSPRDARRAKRPPLAAAIASWR